MEAAVKESKAGGEKPSDTWEQYIPLIGRLVPRHLLPPPPPMFVPGDIVGVAPCGSTPVHVLILSVTDSLITFIGNDQKASIPVECIHELIPISEESLLQELKENPIPSRDTEILQQDVELELVQKRAFVESIIQIFEQNRPLDLAARERKYILQPSPIVWGSFTTWPRHSTALHSTAENP
jgi:hypothetical protein